MLILAVNARIKELRKDKQLRHQKLCQLIAADIAEQPQEFEGYTWAVRSQPDWSSLLGVDERTVRNLIKMPPICTTTTQVEGKKTVLLRLGEPGAKSDRHVANIMAKVFTDKTGRKPSPRDFGMLKGLAQFWPDGVQAEIFRLVLNDWKGFKALVAIVVDDLIAEGKNAFHRRHDFPSIAVIRAFHSMALEMYVMHLQANQLPPPPSIVALHPKLWQHLKPSEPKAQSSE
ncbi:MAG: hypothetical protein J0L76_07705 [Rhodobacterales bacterium]|nr:hypothetical protein [Rhodobacterales bacterium]